jgi:hypothetical protein
MRLWANRRNSRDDEKKKSLGMVLVGAAAMAREIV